MHVLLFTGVWAAEGQEGPLTHAWPHRGTCQLGMVQHHGQRLPGLGLELSGKCSQQDTKDTHGLLE